MNSQTVWQTHTSNYYEVLPVRHDANVVIRQSAHARIQSAKNMMIESSRLFLGLLGTPLVEDILNADEAHLRSAVSHWHMGLRQSGKVGAHVVDQYVSAVKILLYMHD